MSKDIDNNDVIIIGGMFFIIAMLIGILIMGIASTSKARDKFAIRCENFAGYVLYQHKSADLCISQDGRILFTEY